MTQAESAAAIALAEEIKRRAQGPDHLCGRPSNVSHPTINL